jgi:ribosomal-protein-alanine N-acetyltransferase
MYDWVVNDNQMAHYTCREIRPMPAYTEWLDKKLSDQRKSNIILKAMIASDNRNTCIGRFKAFDYNSRNQNFEIGYYFPIHLRGKGLGTIGLPQFINEVFSNPLPVRKLTAWTSEKNIPSQKLLIKSGFCLDGQLRDHFEINGSYCKQLIYSYIRQ